MNYIQYILIILKRLLILWVLNSFENTLLDDLIIDGHSNSIHEASLKQTIFIV